MNKLPFCELVILYFNHFLPLCTMMINENTSLTGANSARLVPMEYFCPVEPIFTWILTDAATFSGSIVISAIACPFTILLNILVVYAVKTRKTLQNNSNILLSSLAVADLLVGFISFPLQLSIALDAFLLQRKIGLFLCRIALANQMVLYISACCSLYHLTVIAWERYVAIRKWKDYKVIVTTKRVTWCLAISWVLCLLKTVLVRVLIASGVNYKYVQFVDMIVSIPIMFAIVLIGYFYLMVYIGMRQRKLTDIRGDAVRAKLKMEKRIAITAATLTLVLLFSYLPSTVVIIGGRKVPFLRTSTVFRWTELLTQLNSLLNPLLYCFVLNRQFRGEVVKMVKRYREDQREPPTPKQSRHSRRRMGHENMDDLQEEEEAKREEDPQVKSGSCGSTMADETRCQGPREALQVTSSSGSSTGAENIITYVDIHPFKSFSRRRLLEGSTDKYAQSKCSVNDDRHSLYDENDDRGKSMKITQEHRQSPNPTQECLDQQSIDSENRNDPIMEELEDGIGEILEKRSCALVIVSDDGCLGPRGSLSSSSLSSEGNFVICANTLQPQEEAKEEINHFKCSLPGSCNTFQNEDVLLEIVEGKHGSHEGVTKLPEGSEQSGNYNTEQDDTDETCF